MPTETSPEQSSPVEQTMSVSDERVEAVARAICDALARKVRVAAVEADADLRERLTADFNARGRSLQWFTHKGELREDAKESAFEFLMGVHAGLIAAGLPGFNGMELMVASVRGADFVFPITARD